MKIKLVSTLITSSFIVLGLAACSSNKPVAPVIKPPRNICDSYSAHVQGIKDGMHKEPMDYDYAKTNNCPYDDSDINQAYLDGYKSGRQMK